MKLLLIGFQPEQAITYPHLQQVAQALIARGADYCLFRERGYFLGEPFDWHRFVHATAGAIRSCIIIVIDTLRLALRRMRCRYELVVATDNFAYVVASRLFPKVILWSHDFLTDDEARSRSLIQRLIKRQVAGSLCRHGSLVIQDRERLDLFQQTYLPGTSSEAVSSFLLPVSLLPVGKPLRPCGVPPVLMQIGGISAWRSRSDELLRDFQQKSDVYSLMFHGYVDSHMAKEIAQSRIAPRVSSRPTPPGEVHAVVEQCDIGFIAYRPENQNFFFVSRSSGQLAEFLRCGKPVIALGASSLDTLLRHEQVGIAIGDVCEVADAVRRIQRDYERYVHSCLRLFETVYDLSRHLPAFTQWLSRHCRS